MIIAIVVLVGLVGAALTSLKWPHPVSALVLGALCALWLLVNNTHIEGPILWTIDEYRGLSTADLASYGGFVLALVSVARWRQRASARDSAAIATVALLTLFLGAALILDWTFQTL